MTDVHAEAVKRLSAGCAHFCHAQDMWTVGKHCTAKQHGDWFLAGCTEMRLEV